MKRSKMFLGFTTLCLAVAGLFAAKPVKTQITSKAYFINSQRACVLSSGPVVPAYDALGDATSQTYFTASNCSNPWIYDSNN